MDNVAIALKDSYIKLIYENF